MVGSRIPCARQMQHSGLRCFRCRIGRSTTSMTVGECGCSFLPVCRQYAPGMACAHSHQRRCLLHRHMLRQQTVEYLKPCLFSLAQCHILHALHVVTFMLNNDNHCPAIDIWRSSGLTSRLSVASDQALSRTVCNIRLYSAPASRHSSQTLCRIRHKLKVYPKTKSPSPKVAGIFHGEMTERSKVPDCKSRGC